MTPGRPRPRASEDLLDEMIRHLGWSRAHALVNREAELLHCPPTSSYAIRSAYAVHQATRAPHDPAQQGELPITN